MIRPAAGIRLDTTTSPTTLPPPGAGSTQAARSDIDAILTVWLDASVKAHDFIESSFWQSQLDNMRDVYLPNSDVWVFELNAQVVGFYALHNNTLAAIFVAPQQQGRGIGKQLLNHAKQQRNELHLTVYKANEPSCRFYRSQGFTLVREQADSHTGHTELLLHFTA